MPIMFNLDLPEGDIPEPIRNVIRYLQDNTNGFPSGITAENIYQDTDPQLIQAIEDISAGDLLNVYTSNSQEILVRKATASDPERYCNSVALSNMDSSSLVLCATRVASFSGNVGGIQLAAGPIYLSPNLGQGSNSIPIGSAIHQLVGYVDPVGNFLFYFHTPFLAQI